MLVRVDLSAHIGDDEARELDVLLANVRLDFLPLIFRNVRLDDPVDELPLFGWLLELGKLLFRLLNLLLGPITDS